MTDSKEYLAMLNKRSQLGLGLQRNMVEIATALNNEGLIDDRCYEVVCKPASMYTDSQKADEMVHKLVDQVKFSEENFRHLLAVLSKSRLHQDIVTMLKEEFSRFGELSVVSGSVGQGLQSMAESSAMSTDEVREEGDEPKRKKIKSDLDNEDEVREESDEPKRKKMKSDLDNEDEIKELEEQVAHGTRSALLQLCRKASFNVNKTYSDHEETLLHLACQRGHLDIVRALIEVYGCSLRTTDKLGNSPLHSACEAGQIKVMNHFYRSAYSNYYFSKNALGDTLLHLACKSGCIPLIRMIIMSSQFDRSVKLNEYRDKMFNPVHCDDVYARNKRGHTPLHVACWHRQFHVVKFFFEEYKIHSFPCQIYSLINLAFDMNDSELIQYFQSKCDDSSTPVQYDHQESQSFILFPQFYTCDNGGIRRIGAHVDKCFVELKFFSIAQRGNMESFEKFRKCTTNISLFSSKSNYGDTLLHAACVSCDRDFVKHIFHFLTENKLFTLEDLRTLKNISGFTCLHIVCELGSLELVNFFLNVGFSVMDTTKLGYTPLHLAIMNDREDIFKYLMELNNEDINAVSGLGETPLHIATYEEHRIEYVRNIVKHKKFDNKNIDKADIRGETPLFNAFRTCDSYLVKLLLNEPVKSDIRARNNRNETVAFIACRLGWTELLDDIISNEKIELGQSLLKAAMDCNVAETNQLLASSGLLQNNWMIVYLYNHHQEFFITHFNELNSLSQLSLLQQSFISRNMEIFKFLLHIPECDGDTKGKNENTVLHLCCEHNNEEYALLCLESNCSIHVLNHLGRTPLHVALSYKHYSLLKNLLTFIFNQRGRISLENCVNSSGNNILHAVAEANSHDDEIVNIGLFILSEKIISHCSKNKMTGSTALHLACKVGYSQMAIKLIELEYSCDLWYNKRFFSPLMEMITSVDYYFVEFLKYIPEKYLHNPYYMLRDNDGCDVMDVPLVLYLIRYKLNNKCPQHQSCLGVSAYGEIILKLLNTTSENLVDSLGNTVFHYLAACCFHKCTGFNNIVDTAFTKHSSLVIKLNNHQESVLHHALSSNSQWLIMKVLEEGVPYKFINESSKHRRFMRDVLLSNHVLHHYLMAKGVFHNSQVRQGASFTANLPSLHVLVLGNSGVGKTTLINTLKEYTDGNGVALISPTTGVVRSEICSKKCTYQLIDFAGQPEFDLVKSKYLESRFALLSQYYIHNKFLMVLVVNAEKSFLENKNQISERTSFIMNHIDDKLLSISTILVCSHADCIEDKQVKYEEVEKLTKYFQKIGKTLNVTNDVFFMNCKSSKNKSAIKMIFDKQASISDILGVFEAESIDLTSYALSPGATELLHFINSKFTTAPVQIKMFLTAIKDLQSFKLNDNGVIVQEGKHFIIPERLELLVQPMRELHAHNHIMLLEFSEETLSGWIVSSSVQDILFSEVSSLFNSQDHPSKSTSLSETNNTGIVSEKKLAHKFNELNLKEFTFEVFLGYLLNMDYCQLLDNASIGHLLETILMEQYDNTMNYYFFPGIISADKPLDLSDFISDNSNNYHYEFGYLLMTKDVLNLQFFQPLMFALFKFTQVKGDSNFCRRIEMWKSGIFWVTPDMVNILVEVRNNKEVLLICQGESDCITSKYAAAIVREIRAKKLTINKSRNISLEEFFLLQIVDKPEYTDKEIVPLNEVALNLHLPLQQRAYYFSDRECVRFEKFLKIDPYVYLVPPVNKTCKISDKSLSHSIIKKIFAIENISDSETFTLPKIFAILDQYSVFNGSDLHRSGNT